MFLIGYMENYKIMNFDKRTRLIYLFILAFRIFVAVVKMYSKLTWDSNSLANSIWLLPSSDRWVFLILWLLSCFWAEYRLNQLWLFIYTLSHICRVTIYHELIIHDRWHMTCGSVKHTLNVLCEGGEKKLNASAPRRTAHALSLRFMRMYVHWANVMHISGPAHKAMLTQEGGLQPLQIHSPLPALTTLNHWV